MIGVWPRFFRMSHQLNSWCQLHRRIQMLKATSFSIYLKRKTATLIRNRNKENRDLNKGAAEGELSLTISLIMVQILELQRTAALKEICPLMIKVLRFCCRKFHSFLSIFSRDEPKPAVLPNHFANELGTPSYSAKHNLVKQDEENNRIMQYMTSRPTPE